MTFSIPALGLAGLHILEVQCSASADQLDVTACSTSISASCPDCAQSTTRVHSRYCRSLADLPASGTAVRLTLQVRRFVCPSTDCPRKTFVEQISNLTTPYAQHTMRLNELLTLLSLACGGLGAARLAKRLQMAASPTTFLRRVRSMDLPDTPTPRVLGVDDFAFRKGRRYGTILCDLERHCAIDLLPDRTGETLAKWLATHPGVEIICRDRASGYAEGAARGAPTATQVADRFHLHQNLVQAVAGVLAQHRRQLRRTIVPTVPVVPTVPSGGSPTLIAPPPTTITPTTITPTPTLQGAHQARQIQCQGRIQVRVQVGSEAAYQARRAARLERYQSMLALRDQGLDQGTIARRLRVSLRTVNGYLNAGGFPEPKRRGQGPDGLKSPSYLDPYLPYLLKRWDEGCHKAVQLWREICAQGYEHGVGLVYLYVDRLRRGERPTQMSISTYPTSLSETDPAEKEQCYTPSEAVWLLLRRPSELSAIERDDVQAMQDRCPAIATVYRLAQSFTQMLRERQVWRLSSWLKEANSSGLPELRSLANGIERDKAAVQAALTLSWSSGQVEGQVNRLKLIKRQMYGRAKLDLLRQRVILRV